MPDRIPCPDHDGDPLDNDDCLGIYLAMRAQGHGAATSAKEIGTTPQAVRKRLRGDPIFAEAVRDADHEYAETLEDKVRQLAEEGDRWALAIMLKRKNPETYGKLNQDEDRRTREAQGSVTLQIGTVNVDSLDGVHRLQAALAQRKAPALPAATQPEIIDVESSEA